MILFFVFKKTNQSENKQNIYKSYIEQGYKILYYIQVNLKSGMG